MCVFISPSTLLARKPLHSQQTLGDFYYSSFDSAEKVVKEQAGDVSHTGLSNQAASGMKSQGAGKQKCRLQRLVRGR